MMTANPPRPNIGGGTCSPNSQKRVQDLNRERQSYRMRQEEILKQVCYKRICTHVGGET